MLFLTKLFTEPEFFFRFVTIVICSISLHELAHGWAAVSQGDDTPQKEGHLTPNPLVHMGWESLVFLCVTGLAWGQMPVNPTKFRSGRLGNILVAVAGPLSNLVLSFWCIAVINLIYGFELGRVFSVQFFTLAAHINLVLFIFNLLPVPPLDGFHILCEFFPEFKLLKDGQVGLFLLMIFLLMPNTVTGLARIADVVIEVTTGTKMANF